MFDDLRSAKDFNAKNWAHILGCQPEDIAFEESNKIVAIPGSPELSRKIVYDILGPDNKPLGTIVITMEPNANGFKCRSVGETGIACIIPM